MLTRSPLLERERELGALRESIGAAARGDGGAAVVAGPAGIGKTALLEAVKVPAREAGLEVLSARCTELEREFPFGVAGQLFGPALARGGRGKEDELLAGAAAPAAGVLGLADVPSVVQQGGAMGAADVTFAGLHALYWLTSNLADRSPLLLAIDDAQWADRASLRFLRFLLPRIKELPALLVLGVRTGDEPESLARLLAESPARWIAPGPLSAAAVAELARSALGEQASEEQIESCRESSGGNPFLLSELLREIAEQGPHAGDPAGAARAPRSVERSVALRLDELGEDATAIARAVAVLGDEAPPRRVAELAGLDSELMSPLLDALVSTGLLASAGPISFLHPLLRDAVYSATPVAMRSAMHSRAAAALEAGDPKAAVHLLNTPPGGDDNVAGVLHWAGRDALARGATGAALRMLERALEEPPAGGRLGAVLADFGVSAIWMGRDDGFEALGRAVKMSTDPGVLGSATPILSAALLMTGRPSEGLAALDEGIAKIKPRDPDLALRIEAEATVLAQLDASTQEIARRRLRAVSSRLPGESAGERQLLAALAFEGATRGESLEKTMALAERALTGGEPLTGSIAFWQGVSALLVGDRLDLAEGCLERATPRGSAGAPSVPQALNSSLRARLAFLRGDVAEAEAEARVAVEATRALGLLGFLPHSVGYLIDALLERGELDEADRLLAESGLDGEGPETLTFALLQYSRGRLRVARGRVEEGLDDLLALEGRRERLGVANPAYAPWASPAAPALARAGRADEARRGLEAELDRARSWGTPRLIGTASLARALVDDDLEALGEAAKVLDGSPARLEQAHALVALGAALRRANRRGQAREQLHRGLDLADSCGAVALADQARVELLAAGARPRRSRTHGPDALTPSERRVAELAVQGMSNPEIAQALFVTKKTVEFHLSNAYRKLEIESRAKLAQALAES